METETGVSPNLSQIGRMVWEYGLPFLTPGAVDRMEQALCRISFVFEWGAGGSTLWFAERAAYVISIEHHRGWYERVAGRLDEEGIENVDLRFIPHRPHEPYTSAILDFAPEHFSLVLVDGRERVRCIGEAMPKVKPGGLLVLDNSRRPRYTMGIEWLASWQRLDFPDRWLTTVFIKPGA